MSSTENRISGGFLPTGAWAVHLLTASGALWGLLALDAVVDGRLRGALGWMALAVVVDGCDGALARVVRARDRLPSIDGALLDNLVDYFNYVVVPAYLLYRVELLPSRLALAGASAICIASAFQFAHVRAKTEDGYFRGFPSYWNVVACYVVLLEPPEWLVAAIVAALCVMVFAPVVFVYPTRTRRLRGTTLVLMVIWGAVLLFSVWRYPAHADGWVYASLAYVVYYVVLSSRFSLQRLERHSG